MYITSHCQTNLIDFSENQMNSFFTGKKNSYTLWPMESNCLMCFSIQTGHSIELKFGMYIISHCPTYYVNFGEFKINSFFTGVQK